MNDSIKWYVCCEDECMVPKGAIDGICVWRPSIRTNAIRDGEWTDVSEGAYDGYVFVGSVHGWRYIEEKIPGLRLIRGSCGPYEMSEEEISAIRFFDTVEFNVVDDFSSGDRIRIKENADSPYSGMWGVVEKLIPVRGGAQACVEFEIGGVEVKAFVSVDLLEVV